MDGQKHQESLSSIVRSLTSKPSCLSHTIGNRSLSAMQYLPTGLRPQRTNVFCTAARDIVAKDESRDSGSTLLCYYLHFSYCEQIDLQLSATTKKAVVSCDSPPPFG
jgi:hypothetical protein